MKIKIYHHDPSGLGPDVHVATFDAGHDRTIADLPVPHEVLLDQAYQATQNIEGSWALGPEITIDRQIVENSDYDPRITVHGAATARGRRIVGIRSTLVGDTMTVGDGPDAPCYRVAPMGWTRLAR